MSMGQVTASKKKKKDIGEELSAVRGCLSVPNEPYDVRSSVQ